MSKKNKKKSKVIIYPKAAFEAARDSRRTENWFSPDSGPNSGLRHDWRWLVKRHQDLADNEPLAKRAVGVIVNNWVGDGVISTPANATKRYKNAHTDWARSVESDFYELQNSYGVQSLGARTCAVRGAYLLRKRIKPELYEKYGFVPLQLQLLEAEWLDTTKDNGVNIIFGQQFDDNGRLQGYWIRNNHPNESMLWSGARIQSTFVDKNDITLVFDCLRPGQRMGIPFGTAAILTLRDMGDTREAQLLKDKLTACFFGVTSGEDPNPPNGQEVQYGQMFDTITPGAVEHLPPGRTFNAFNPPGSGDFVATRKSYAHDVAAAYEITYESLTGDLSDVNFSSFRGGWLEFHRRIAHLRWNLFIPRHCATVCRWHDELAQIAGLLRAPVRWTHTPPRREMIDPTKEIPALIAAIKGGLMSLSEAKRSLGYIPEEVTQELQKDIQEARDAGLRLSCDGATDAPGALPQAVESDEDNKDQQE
jgi:lambda family phage portal protein